MEETEDNLQLKGLPARHHSNISASMTAWMEAGTGDLNAVTRRYVA
jgi:hypothetical protein